MGMVVGPCAIFLLQVGRLLVGVIPSQIGVLGIVQAWVKRLNWGHFRHWFGRLEYKILCEVVSFMDALSTMEGMRM